jgi:hypothetical protein
VIVTTANATYRIDHDRTLTRLDAENGRGIFELIPYPTREGDA